MKSPRFIYLLLLAASLGAWALLVPCPAAAAKQKILVMPKLVGIPCYNVVKKGVDEASNELKSDTTVLWQGPTTDQVDKQIEMLDNAVAAKPSVIAVAADDPAAIVPVLRKAKAAGSHVTTRDGDADYREVFVNFVRYDAFGAALVEEMVKQVGEMRRRPW